MNLENLDYQDWVPGPSPMRSVYPSMSEEDISIGPGARWAVWKKDISERVRPGCVLRMSDGCFILIGDATADGNMTNPSIFLGGPFINVQNITGVAYPFETGRMADRLREAPFEEKVRQYGRLATDPTRSEGDEVLMASLRGELLTHGVEFDWQPVPRDAEIAPESYQEPEDEWYDDMDGDHESALASAGLGTSEDYGHFGDDDDWG